MQAEIPTEGQVRGLTADLHSRGALPKHVEQMIRDFPKGMHPMTQMSIALLACQTESKFAKAYSDGIHKKEYWDPTLEDCLDVIAKLPRIAALIYRCTFKVCMLANLFSSFLSMLLFFSPRSCAPAVYLSHSPHRRPHLPLNLETHTNTQIHTCTQTLGRQDRRPGPQPGLQCQLQPHARLPCGGLPQDQGRAWQQRFR
jgi:hypothetical protein